MAFSRVGRVTPERLDPVTVDALGHSRSFSRHRLEQRQLATLEHEAVPRQAEAKAALEVDDLPALHSAAGDVGCHAPLADDALEDLACGRDIALYWTVHTFEESEGIRGAFSISPSGVIPT